MTNTVPRPLPVDPDGTFDSRYVLRYEATDGVITVATSEPTYPRDGALWYSAEEPSGLTLIDGGNPYSTFDGSEDED